MAFDGSAFAAAVGEAEDLYEALAYAYVSPIEESTSPAVLNAQQVQLLTTWVGTLIPGNDDWPSAEALNVVGYIDKTLTVAPSLQPGVAQALQTAQTLVQGHGKPDLGALDLDKRVEVLQAVEQAHPAIFHLLKEFTYESYYRHRKVIPVIEKRTGFRSHLANDGVGLAQFDDILMELPEGRDGAAIRGMDL